MFWRVRLISHNILMKAENYPNQRKQIVETFHFPLDRESGAHGEKTLLRLSSDIPNEPRKKRLLLSITIYIYIIYSSCLIGILITGFL